MPSLEGHFNGNSPRGVDLKRNGAVRRPLQDLSNRPRGDKRPSQPLDLSRGTKPGDRSLPTSGDSRSPSQPLDLSRPDYGLGERRKQYRSRRGADEILLGGDPNRDHQRLEGPDQGHQRLEGPDQGHQRLEGPNRGQGGDTQRRSIRLESFLREAPPPVESGLERDAHQPPGEAVQSGKEMQEIKPGITLPSGDREVRRDQIPHPELSESEINELQKVYEDLGVNYEYEKEVPHASEAVQSGRETAENPRAKKEAQGQVEAINKQIGEAEHSMRALFGDNPPEDKEIRKILDEWNAADKFPTSEKIKKISDVHESLKRLGVSDLKEFNTLRKEDRSLERALNSAEENLRALGRDPHSSEALSQPTQDQPGVQHGGTSELPGDSRSASPGPEQGVASRGRGLERDPHLKEVQSDREMQEKNTGRIPERIRKQEEAIDKRKMEIDRVKKDIAGLFKETPEPETMQEILDRLGKVDRMREINLEDDEDLKAQISKESNEADRLLASHIADGDFDPQKFGSLRKDYKGLKEKLDSDEGDLHELHEILVDLSESDGGSLKSFLGKSPLRKESKAVAGRDVGVLGLKAYDTPDKNNNCAIYAMLGAAGFDMQSPEAGEVARRTKLSLASDGKVWNRNKMLEFKGSETGTGVDAFLKLREAGIIPEGRGLRVYTEYGSRDYIPGKEPICIYLNSKKKHFEALTNNDNGGGSNKNDDALPKQFPNRQINSRQVNSH